MTDEKPYKVSKFEIDISDKYEMKFWSKMFNAAQPEIINAIQKTQSNSWSVILRYLKKTQ